MTGLSVVFASGTVPHSRTYAKSWAHQMVCILSACTSHRNLTPTLTTESFQAISSGLMLKRKGIWRGSPSRPMMLAVWLSAFWHKREKLIG